MVGRWWRRAAAWGGAPARRTPGRLRPAGWRGGYRGRGRCDRRRCPDRAVRAESPLRGRAGPPEGAGLGNSGADCPAAAPPSGGPLFSF